jgi:hypothetical protein
MKSAWCQITLKIPCHIILKMTLSRANVGSGWFLEPRIMGTEAPIGITYDA